LSIETHSHVHQGKTDEGKYEKINLNVLNKSQLNAVCGPSNQIIRVLAGPGSGKTRVLTYRVAHLIATGTQPWSILAVTFTNKASSEVQERVKELVGENVGAKVTVGTFHSICARLLREFGEFLPPPLNSKFSIFDSKDVTGIIKKLMQEKNIDIKKFTPASVASCISRLKNTNSEVTEPGLALQNQMSVNHVAEQIYATYQQELKKMNAMDFDDLLLCGLNLLQTEVQVRSKLRNRWFQVLVDEWQDTNYVQYQFVKLLALGCQGDPPLQHDFLKKQGLLVVGDDDQSIYGWRGAEWENIQRLETDFPDLKTVVLQENYRSTSNIASAADAIINQCKNRVRKEMFAVRGAGDMIEIVGYANDEAEAWGVLGKAKQLRALGVRPKDIAVLYRTNAQSNVLEKVFVQSGTAYVIFGGQRFYDRAEVKDILSYLKFLSNPYDTMSITRAAQAPKRGLGDKTIANLLQWSKEKSDVQPTSFLTHLLAFIPKDKWENQPVSIASEMQKEEFWPGIDINLCRSMEAKEITTLQASRLISFVELALELWIKARCLTVVDLIKEIIAKTGFEDHLQSISKDNQEFENRWENVQEMCKAADKFSPNGCASAGALQSYLEEVSLISGNKEEIDETQGAIKFMTVHAAKGLEFEAVFMVGMEEGTFPLERGSKNIKELEEERRLAYVGVTRAKSHLHLSWRMVKNAYFSKESGWNNLKYKRSRFLDVLDNMSIASGGDVIESYNVQHKFSGSGTGAGLSARKNSRAVGSITHNPKTELRNDLQTGVSKDIDRTEEQQRVLVEQALHSGGLRISSADLLQVSKRRTDPGDKPRMKDSRVSNDKKLTSSHTAKDFLKPLGDQKSAFKKMKVPINNTAKFNPVRGTESAFKNAKLQIPTSKEILQNLGFSTGVAVSHTLHGKGIILEMHCEEKQNLKTATARVKFETGVQITIPVNMIQSLENT